MKVNKNGKSAASSSDASRVQATTSDEVKGGAYGRIKQSGKVLTGS